VNAPASPPSFWHRRVRAPLVALFTQGVTPDKIALTFAVGSACSLFPFLGFTSLLNLGAGLWLRLNQPLLQTLNQLLGPLQLLLILGYVRVGEWLWRAEGGRFTLAEMLAVFRQASLREFLQRFGWAGVHAFTAWAVTSPLLVAGVYCLLRPLLRRLASRSASRP
jgi:uncharacterized protein (DUF2062 family)